MSRMRSWLKAMYNNIEREVYICIVCGVSAIAMELTGESLIIMSLVAINAILHVRSVKLRARLNEVEQLLNMLLSTARPEIRDLVLQGWQRKL